MLVGIDNQVCTSRAKPEIMGDATEVGGKRSVFELRSVSADRKGGGRLKISMLFA